jgi:uncharacterized protein YaeQ
LYTPAGRSTAASDSDRTVNCASECRRGGFSISRMLTAFAGPSGSRIAAAEGLAGWGTFGMALSSTMYAFTVRLADADRGVYETLALRVAQHPSETAEYLVTRLLAYCLEYTAGIAFSKGISDPDEPAIAVRDLTGALQSWIDVGLPEAARLHKASKAARRVAVYPHRDAAPWLARLEGERIHRAEALEIYEIDRELLAGLASRLERRLEFDLSVSERNIYVSLGDVTFTGTIEGRRLAR